MIIRRLKSEYYYIYININMSVSQKTWKEFQEYIKEYEQTNGIQDIEGIKIQVNKYTVISNKTKTSTIDVETKDLIIRAFALGLYQQPEIIEELKSSSLIESDYFEDENG